MITIKTSFDWSPDGFTIKTIDAGDHEELPDRAIEIASELGLLVENKQKPAAKK